MKDYLSSLNNGEFSSDTVMLQAANTGGTFTTTVDGNSETFDYSIYYTKNKPTTTPTVTSKYIHKLQTLTAYPDRSTAEVYDENGNLNKNVALSPNSDWQTDEYMTIKGEKYYRVATNEFVKADNVDIIR